MPTTRLQVIAHEVRSGRARRGWTQAELADRVGVNPQTIGHIERAMHMPTRQGLLERLEDALDIDLSVEAQAGHEMIQEIADRLSERMRELGPLAGMALASAVLNTVQSWQPRKPRQRPVVPVDGDSPENAER